MIYYVHPNGQVDFRVPPSRPIVGVIFSKVGQYLIFSAGLTIEQIIQLSSHTYQQQQICNHKVES